MAKKKTVTKKKESTPVKKRAKRGTGLKYKDKAKLGLCTVGGCKKKHGKRSTILCDEHAEAKSVYMKNYMQAKRDEAKAAKGKKTAKKVAAKKPATAKKAKAPKSPVTTEQKKAG